jgi:hypothetical protein
MILALSHIWHSYTLLTSKPIKLGWKKSDPSSREEARS